MPGHVPVDQRRGVDGAREVKEVTRKIGIKRVWQRVAGLGKVAWRKTSKESILSANAPSTGDPICVHLSCQLRGWTYIKFFEDV